jgi:cell division septal protein FtsQ
MSSSSNPPAARTWRDIPQEIAPRAMSRVGRKRLAMATFKSVAIVLLLGASVWAGYEMLRLFQYDRQRLQAPVKGEPVRRIELSTDGVLAQPEVERMLRLPKGVTLMELDLFALRERLLVNPQVRTAVLARKFPDTLSVLLEERSPVARINLQVGDSEPTEHLVARDGVVFVGTGFNAGLIDTLPHLDGVTLKRTKAGAFVPLEGMDKVAELLGTARGNIPILYDKWRVVSLEKFASDGMIVVRATDLPEIVFGTRDDFFRQIAQLDIIVEQTRNQAGAPVLRSINLAVGGSQVPVAFAPPPPAPVEPRAGASARVAPQASPFVREQPQRSVPRRPSSAFFQPQRSTPL